MLGGQMRLCFDCSASLPLSGWYLGPKSVILSCDLVRTKLLRCAGVTFSRYSLQSCHSRLASPFVGGDSATSSLRFKHFLDLSSLSHSPDSRMDRSEEIRLWRNSQCLNFVAHLDRKQGFVEGHEHNPASIGESVYETSRRGSILVGVRKFIEGCDPTLLLRDLHFQIFASGEQSLQFRGFFSKIICIFCSHSNI